MRRSGVRVTLSAPIKSNSYEFLINAICCLGWMGGVIASVFAVDMHLIHLTDRQFLQSTLKPDGSSVDGVTDTAGDSTTQ